MNVLFIGYVVNKDTQDKSKVVSVAGNKFQLGLLGELNKKVNLNIVSVMPMAAWPNGKKIWNSKCKIHENDLEISLVPFCNIRFLKEISLFVVIAIRIFKYCFKNRNAIIVTYNGESYFTIPIKIMKIFFRFKYVCMMVDAPNYQGTIGKTNFFWNWLYKLKALFFQNALYMADGIVVLNRGALKKRKPKGKTILIEGGIEEEEYKEDNGMQTRVEFDKAYLNMVFTGTLHEHSGIMSLIKAFEKMNQPDFRLYIFGTGVLEKDVIQAARKVNNIFFEGYIANREILYIQKQADVLICPNEINHPINKEAFPSKLLEYMMSGTPVVATKLDCISKNYAEHLFLYDGTEKQLKTQLENIMRLPENERKLWGENARKFILEDKSWGKQVQKLVSWLETI